MNPVRPDDLALLVVDDELAFLALYELHLGSRYRLLLCRSGDEALDAIARERQAGRSVAAGFFHLRLAGAMNRAEAICRARALAPRLLCTLVNGSDPGELDAIEHAFGDGHEDEWDYVSRPLTGIELIHKARHAVSSWLRRRRDESERDALRRGSSARDRFADMNPAP
jgi:CheY-like chemotaxis protein